MPCAGVYRAKIETSTCGYNDFRHAVDAGVRAREGELVIDEEVLLHNCLIIERLYVELGLIELSFETCEIFTLFIEFSFERLYFLNQLLHWISVDWIVLGLTRFNSIDKLDPIHAPPVISCGNDHALNR